MSDDLSNTYSGIGFFAHIGLRLTHSQEGKVVGELDVGPEHRNRAGYVHGGVLCTMLDFGACGAGLHSEPGERRRFGVTLSLSTQFTKAVDKGRLRVEGQMLSAGRRTYTAEARILDDGGDLVAHAIGTFQWRSGSEPAAISAA